MYNSNIPTQAELPTSSQLFKSTAIALVAAGALLVTVVLPAEYGIDPTGVGRVLNLTEMGEIKRQLAEEAEADRKKDQPQTPAPSPAQDKRSSLTPSLWSLFISSAVAQEAKPKGMKREEITFTLKPAQGVEYKLSMNQGAKVKFSWTANGGKVNYDMHGSPTNGKKERSYKAARGVPGQEGELVAAFDGKHGWFWRNRTRGTVTINLKVEGAYSKLEKTM